MKNYLLPFLILSALLTNKVLAQTNILYGENLAEKDAQAQIVMLKNGNTALVQLMRDGMSIDLYDKTKRKVSGESFKPVTPEKEKGESSLLVGVLETNGNFNVFYARHLTKHSLLNRLEFDGRTGKLIKEITVIDFARIPKESSSRWVPDRVNGIINFCAEFKLSTDGSGNYGIAVFTPYPKDPKLMLEAIHYSNEHSEINRSFLQLPGVYDKLALLELQVINNKNLIVISNIVSSVEKKGSVYFSKLTTGSNTFQNTQLTGTSAYIGSNCSSNYNTTDNKLYTVVCLKIKEDRLNEEYSWGLFKLDLATMRLDPGTSLSIGKVSTDYQSKSKKLYNGIPHNYTIDPNNNHLLLTARTHLRSDGSTYIESLGMTNISNLGKEAWGVSIPYHVLMGSEIHSFGYKKSERLMFMHAYSKARFIDIIAGKKYTYVLLDNTVENYETPVNKEQGMITSIGGTTSICYKIDKTGNVANSYLFEKPANSASRKIGLFNTSCYNPETGEYAVLIIEKGDKGTTSKIAWMILE